MSDARNTPQLVMLCLAKPSDAVPIAAMSRDLIEAGLGWSWTAVRVGRAICSRETSVLIARRSNQLCAFAIMYFGDEAAHLNLLAVAPAVRRTGIGRRLLDWLHVTALESGLGCIDLELRAANTGARAFYERMGYELNGQIPGYYRGQEAALRMSKRLRNEAPPGSR
jgi:[ribosomal protein S18]-alanine N-acetyltransferase